jgi:predicted nucleic acid-binding protein
MSGFICIDCSIIIKLLTWEEGSDKAADLIEKVVEEGRTIVLPDFAWAEVGSVLRKKVARKEITAEEAEEAWGIFSRLKIIDYMGYETAAGAWRISVEENLSTLYDSAYLSVAESAAGKSKSVCEYWTADEKLVNSLSDKRGYVRCL